VDPVFTSFGGHNRWIWRRHERHALRGQLLSTMTERSKRLGTAPCGCSIWYFGRTLILVRAASRWGGDWPAIDIAFLAKPPRTGERVNTHTHTVHSPGFGHQHIRKISTLFFFFALVLPHLCGSHFSFTSLVADAHF